MDPFNKAQSISDEQLMDNYKAGELNAFEELYKRHKDTVYSYLSKRLKDDQDKEEVFQNVFIKLHKFRANYDNSHLFIKWLYTISRSELYDFCKKRKMNTVVFEDNILIKEEVKEVDGIEINDLKMINEKEKKALILRYYGDDDYEQISIKLNTSTSNARKLVSRAIKKIRTKLNRGENE